jgi:hypothetical protein
MLDRPVDAVNARKAGPAPLLREPSQETDMTDQHIDGLGKQLLSLEQEGWNALTEGNGAQYYERHLADDALMILPIGALTRDESIQAMAAAPPWATFQLDDPRVVELGADGAVLTYRASAQRSEQEPYTALITTVFVRRNGSWMPIFHQQTPIDAATDREPRRPVRPARQAASG